jgi:hypothetical protein
LPAIRQRTTTPEIGEVTFALGSPRAELAHVHPEGLPQVTVLKNGPVSGLPTVTDPWALAEPNNPETAIAATET